MQFLANLKNDFQTEGGNSLDDQLIQIRMANYFSLEPSEQQTKASAFCLKMHELRQAGARAQTVDAEQRICTTICRKLKAFAEHPNASCYATAFLATFRKVPPLSTDKTINMNAVPMLLQHRDTLPDQPNPTKLDDLIHRFLSSHEFNRRLAVSLKTIFGIDIAKVIYTEGKQDPKRKDHKIAIAHSEKQTAKQTAKQEQPTKKIYCNGCGYKNHAWAECKMKTHPQFNHDEKTPFHLSNTGKEYLEKLKQAYPEMKGNFLSNKHYIIGGKMSKSITDLVPNIQKGNPPSCLMNIQSSYQLNALHESNPDFVNITILSETGERLTVSALLDNGAYNGNHCYINYKVADFLISVGNVGIDAPCKVCSAIRGSCVNSAKEFNFKFIVTNEFNINKTFSISTIAIDSEIDMFINRQFIKENSLVFNFPSHFMNAGDIQTMFPNVGRTDGQVSTTSVENSAYPNVGCGQTHQQEETLAKSAVLDISPDDDGGLQERWESHALPWENPPQENPNQDLADHEFIPKNISGCSLFIQGIRAVCLTYIAVFKRSVSTQPARIRPFEILINIDKWEQHKKQLKNSRPRMQSRERQAEIQRQNNIMMDLKVIRPSEALYLSQVNLAKKSNGTWRYCVDFRNLNDMCDAHSWPLPNIKQTLDRLGRKRWKYFGILDLTAGYWQAPLAELSKKYTAFATWMGNFEWERVPFGLKGAPSFYQKEIQQTVLRELMHTICEAYMDDIIFGGETEEEYLANLVKILHRLKEHNITVNPDKCTFGVTSIEVVGHVIDRTGITFSTAKKEGVMEFPLPQNEKQLHSFLGLGNYFRDHIDHYTEHSALLYQFLSHHSTTKTLLDWTPELKQQFEELKLKIYNCPKLYFLNDTDPIHLCTDASKYGVGAYLYQLVDGIEYPIQFISMTLNETRQRWSVPEKEAFAIYYALTKLEYLLRDRFFYLHTDHINLTYINDNAATSAKVYNWKLTIQEFNFAIRYIKGPLNIVADKMSRLCSLHIETGEINHKVLFINALYDRYIPDEIRHAFNQVHNAVVGHNGINKTLLNLIKKKEMKNILLNIFKNIMIMIMQHLLRKEDTCCYLILIKRNLIS
jgi:hypothetical protein